MGPLAPPMRRIALQIIRVTAVGIGLGVLGWLVKEALSGETWATVLAGVALVLDCVVLPRLFGRVGQLLKDAKEDGVVPTPWTPKVGAFALDSVTWHRSLAECSSTSPAMPATSLCQRHDASTTSWHTLVCRARLCIIPLLLLLTSLLPLLSCRHGLRTLHQQDDNFDTDKTRGFIGNALSGTLQGLLANLMFLRGKEFENEGQVLSLYREDQRQQEVGSKGEMSVLVPTGKCSNQQGAQGMDLYATLTQESCCVNGSMGGLKSGLSSFSTDPACQRLTSCCTALAAAEMRDQYKGHRTHVCARWQHSQHAACHADCRWPWRLQHAAGRHAQVQD